jgi:predicted secreted hydrolase
MKRIAGSVVVLLAAAATVLAQTEWRSADATRQIVLPADHASHPDYKLEWWYYTGNVSARDGRRFGYQLTFFRIGVTPAPPSASAWSVRDLFMAHLAITDVSRGTYRFAERLNRAGPSWAGASTSGYHVWNDNWSVVLDAGGRHRLQATNGRDGVDLTLTQTRPPVLHGDRGYSQKGSMPGNASHYYSLTRLPTEGSLLVDGTRVEVSGLSWMDHEFGTTFLEAGQRGWNWFAVHLDDGRDLMLYQFRREDGALDPHSSGTLVNTDGTTVRIAANDFSAEPGHRWTSRATRAQYPIEWRIRMPREQLDLVVMAPVRDQELLGERSGVNYWEGAVDVSGTAGGRPIRGRGYLEMTGYSGRAMVDALK